jgi:hypothetical protein
MTYIISENKVYESTPPFSQVGEITEGTITILTLNEKEENDGRKVKRGRTTKVRTEVSDTGGEAGGMSERVPELS